MNSPLPQRFTLSGDEAAPGAGGLWELWLIAVPCFLAAIAGVVMQRRWWRPVMLAAILLSTALIALDWAPAFRGAIINAAILVAMAVAALRA